MPYFRVTGAAPKIINSLMCLAMLLAPIPLAAEHALAASSTIFVDGSALNCSDSSTDTSTQPFCTISHAANVANAGQTVQVASGTYSGQVTVANSGQAGLPITFAAAPGALVTITRGVDGFALSGKSHIAINGFTIVNTTKYGISASSGSDITISNNTVSFSGQPAQGSTAAGIYLSSVTNSQILRNTSHDNSDHGIYLAAGSTNNIVSGNITYHNAEQWQRNANGIDDVASNNSIVNNTAYNNEDSGINIYPGANNSLVGDNLSYNNGDHGIDDLNVTGGRIIGNTIYHNCTSGINVEGTSGTYSVENNVSADNGIFVVHPTPIHYTITNDCQARRDGDIGIWDSAPATTTVDYNETYLSNPGTLYGWSSNYTALSAFQTASHQGSHELQSDPKFVSATTGNFNLSAGSLAIDSANAMVSGEQTTDRAGNPRYDDPASPNTFGTQYFADRGAFEYQGTGTPPPAVAPTASLSLSAQSVVTPFVITADASKSVAGTNPIASYVFDFGDGNVASPQTTTTANHTYNTAGTYTVKVTVTDSTGLTSSASQSITVTAPPPAPTNLVGNSGFENGLSGWKAYGIGSLAQISGGHSGSFAVEADNPSTSAASCGLNDSPNWVATTSAGTYTSSVWVRANVSNTIKLKLTEYSGSTSLGSTTTSASLTSSWQQITATYTVTQPGSTLDFNLYVSSATPGQCFQSDDIAISHT